MMEEEGGRSGMGESSSSADGARRPRNAALVRDDDRSRRNVIPSATYRVQLNGRFRFEDARGIIPYLDKLGISHLYSSPILKAKRGSPHCYDVVDHRELNQELGGRDEFDSLTAELRRRSMGLLLDIVPNHMSAGEENALWMDVLESGPFSRYASFFDIRWSGVGSRLRNRVLLPVLLDEYDRVLKSGGLRLHFVRDQASFFVVLQGGLQFPLALRSYAEIFQSALEGMRNASWRRGSVADLKALVEACKEMPEPRKAARDSSTTVERRARRLKRDLNALLRRDTNLIPALEGAIRRIGEDGRRLDSILEGQFYRLAYWRDASKEINYRRFLNVNDLVAIRVEEDVVFRESHALILDLVAEGDVSGLRIDHPDGLWDPTQYFRRLMRRTAAAAYGRHADGGGFPVYVVAEKIIRRGEELPKHWAVHGTTGYDFANQVNGLFVFPESAGDLERIYSEFVGRSVRLDDLEYVARKQVMESSMESDLRYLTGLLTEISKRSGGPYVKLVPRVLSSALKEVIACFPRYRTYVSRRRQKLTGAESRDVMKALADARRRESGLDQRAIDLLRRVLLLLLPSSSGSRPDEMNLTFLMRFQQMTGVVMVKGVEDTAFYRYNRLVSINEVGGDLGSFGISIERFHRANQLRRERWPHAMLTTTTHDTKRGEDVRARINVLSEIPSEWESALLRWSRMNSGRRSSTALGAAPSRNDEYLLYQTLLGVWSSDEGHDGGPELTERIVAYMRKASKEAKERTSWIDPNPEYDSGLENFVRSILKGGKKKKKSAFLRDFISFQKRIAKLGMLNSLSQLLLKLTCPGVPDIYQGNEIWDFSLVDPDNRRPVDFSGRMAMLDAITERVGSSGGDLTRFARDLLTEAQDGTVKMYVLVRTLQYRRGHAALFEQGHYTPLRCLGAKQENVCAFSREIGGESFVVVAPRFFARLGGSVGERIWKNTRIIMSTTTTTTATSEPSAYRNIFTGEKVRPSAGEEGSNLELSTALRNFPVALLHALG